MFNEGEKFESGPEEIPENKEKNLITFRDLRLEDCDDMVRVVNSVVEDGAPIQRKEKTTREEWLPVLEKILDKVEKKEDICVAAEMNGHVVGWLAGGKTEDAEIATADIFTAILAKEARGFKNFRELAREWLERAQQEWGIKRIITETSNANRAKNLYKRMGFVETGKPTTRKDYVELEKYLE